MIKAAASSATGEDPIRVLIVDDHIIVREGLRALIERRKGFIIAGEAADGDQAVRLAGSLKPSVILMDLKMPNKNGIEAIREIRASDENARILVLTSYAEDEQVLAAIQGGALGYLLKDSSPEELIEAMRCVHRGEASLHPSVQRKLILGMRKPTGPNPPAPATPIDLTEREVEVLCLVARGMANGEIADQLSVGEGTVRFHVSNILSKLSLENRTQAVLYALRNRLVKLEDL
jgi:NarL family two-component system response regulator LiaR